MTDITPEDEPAEELTPSELAQERMTDTGRARIIGRGVPRRFDDFGPAPTQPNQAMTAAGNPTPGVYGYALAGGITVEVRIGDEITVSSDDDGSTARALVSAANDGWTEQSRFRQLNLQSSIEVQAFLDRHVGDVTSSWWTKDG